MRTFVQATFGLFIVVCTLQSAAAESWRIVYPRIASGSDIFADYYWGLLEDACRKTESDYGPCDIDPIDDYMNHRRAMEELKVGIINLYVRAYVPDTYRDHLDLVPFPLDKGLIGHRIALIHRDNQDRIREIMTQEDLAHFSIGQGLVWLDSDILESAEMNVIRSSSYEGLFPMLMSGRIDLFTRGANEVLGEYQNQRENYPNLAIEESMIISYPMAFYFLVRKDEKGQKLKERLLDGLNQMRDEGEFERRYQTLKATVLNGLNIEARRFIRLPNNYYDDPSYKLDVPEMWDTLQ